MAICSEIRLKLLQKLLQMYKYTMFVNKYALQIVLQNCTLSVAETNKNDKNICCRLLQLTING